MDNHRELGVEFGEFGDELDGVSYFDTADVAQAVFTMIGEGAIGRKFYSARDPPALGEDYPDNVSF